MKTAINQVFTEEEPESGGFKAQMRVLEEEKQREEDLQNIKSVIGEELTITHSAQIISLFTSNQQTADYLGKMLSNHEDELSVDFISNLIEQGLKQEELEQMLDQVLSSASANITKDKTSIKKQLAKLFELLAVLERTVRQNQTQLQNPEQLQNALRQMQEKVRDLAKSGNVENIQKFLKEGELKTAIKQSVELAVKKPETFRNAADDVAARIRESQQQRATQNPQQYMNAASIDNSLRNLAMQNRQQPVSQQSQLTLNTASNPVQNLNAALISSLQINQAISKPSGQSGLENRQANISVQQQVQSQTQQQVLQTQQQSLESKSGHQAGATIEKPLEPSFTNKPKTKVEPSIDRPRDTSVTPKPEEGKPNEPPPTKAHVHSGNCCGANQVGNYQAPKEVREAVEKGLPPEQRNQMLETARQTQGVDSKRAVEVNAGLSKAAQQAF